MKYVVTVLFHIKAHAFEEFLELVLENARRSLEDEEGCLKFDVCTDGARPGEVFLYEIYTSRDAFTIHTGTDHFKTFDAAVQGMVTGKDVKTFAQVH